MYFHMYVDFSVSRFFTICSGPKCISVIHVCVHEFRYVDMYVQYVTAGGR